MHHCYVGATMDQVAARASVSKQTLYKQFTDKENLFAEVILEAILTQLFGRLTDAADVAAESDDVRKGLRALADGCLLGLLQPDVIRLRRLVIGEADRFPAVGKEWFGTSRRSSWSMRGHTSSRGASPGHGRWLVRSARSASRTVNVDDRRCAA